MRNPINKRVLRDLVKEWKKYIILVLLMSFMIASASGIFVANGSMMAAIDESYSKYNIEDGHFELEDEATEDLLSAMPDSIKIYELFAKELEEGDGAVVRVYKIRNEVNKTCVIEGRLPEKDDEIAIDRMHANNKSVVVGDNLKVGGRDYKVVGLIAMSDYSTLFKNNSDIMFNAIDFDVAVVTPEAWEEMDANIIYNYAYKIIDKPSSESEVREFSDDLIEKIAVIAATGGFTDNEEEAKELAENVEAWQAYLNNIDPMTADMNKVNEVINELKELEEYEDDINELKDFVPEYANQAIHFAADDFGSDQAMMGVLVYIFIAVLAFVFAITTKNTIESEAAVIGTLRATGYTRSEMLRYYMLMPTVITIISSVAGNVLGYTLFKDVVVSMYYNSYSLVTYETLWNAKAFIYTTVVPLILVLIINFAVIIKYIRLSPLRFLRRDLSTSKRKKAIRLPRMGFLSRFRMRVFLQNIVGYIVLFFGISFVMLLLAFAVGLTETLDHYKETMTENLIANYQYVLKDIKDDDGNIIETSTDGAEKFSMAGLVTVDGVHVGEPVSVYGYDDGSKYIDINESLSDQEIIISDAFANKFLLKAGDELTLKEKYSDTSYEFTIKGIHTYPGGIAVFMPNDEFNKVFELDEGSFSGFLSNEKITDIDEEMIYMVITKEDVMALSTQIEHSMGNYMDYVSFACLIIGVLVIYLLTKIIIEKNAGAISLVKVLGYDNSEINSIYIRLTTVIVVIFSVITSFLGVGGLALTFRVIMYSMSGWFDVYVSALSYVKMIGILLLSYLVVAFFDILRIRKVPLTDALKNVE